MCVYSLQSSKVHHSLLIQMEGPVSVSEVFMVWQHCVLLGSNH